MSAVAMRAEGSRPPGQGAPRRDRRLVPVPVVLRLGMAFAIVLDTTTKVSLGPINLSGLLTLGVMGAFVVFAPLVAGPTFRALPLPLVAFGAYTIVRLIASPNAEGLQNIALFIVFLLGIPFVARTTRDASTGAEVAAKGVRIVAGVGVAVSLLFVVNQLLALGLYQPRSFGLTALVFLAAAVAIPRTRFWTRVGPFVIAGAVVYGLSRTASALCIALLVGLAVHLRKGKRLLVAGIGAVVAAAGAAVLVVAYAPLRNRFLTGDNAAQVGGIPINTSGRTSLWEAVWQSYTESPLFGKGPGSAVQLVTDRFVRVTQPHNEYLRILHDYGVVGMSLFGLGMLVLLIRIGARAVRSDEAVHWAALFALAAVLAAAVTDNVLVYPFVMLPLAALVGLSMGRPLVPRPPH